MLGMEHRTTPLWIVEFADRDADPSTATRTCMVGGSDADDAQRRAIDVLGPDAAVVSVIPRPADGGASFAAE